MDEKFSAVIELLEYALDGLSIIAADCDFADMDYDSSALLVGRYRKVATELTALSESFDESLVHRSSRPLDSKQEKPILLYDPPRKKRKKRKLTPEERAACVSLINGLLAPFHNSGRAIHALTRAVDSVSDLDPDND